MGCGEGAERSRRGRREGVERRATECPSETPLMQWQPYVLEAATLRGVPERDAVDAVALARGHRTVGKPVA